MTEIAIVAGQPLLEITQSEGAPITLEVSATGPSGPMGEQGTEGVSTGFKWQFDSSTSMDNPGSGFFRLNHGSFSLVTSMVISENGAEVDGGVPLLGGYLGTWDDIGSDDYHGTILMKRLGAQSSYAIYSVLGPIVDQGSYFQVPLQFVASQNSLVLADWVDDDEVIISFTPAEQNQVVLDAITALQDETEALESSQLLLYLKTADKTPKEFMCGVNIFVDPFASESQIDVAASTNEVYDATNDRYAPSRAADQELPYLNTYSDVNNNINAWKDGVNSHTAANAAGKLAAQTAYAGTEVAPRKRIAEVVCYASSDQGFVETINPNNTFNLRGKQGAAPNTPATDGSLLATLTVADSTATQTITVTDPALVFPDGVDHVWLYFTHNGAANSIRFGEIEFFEAVYNNMTVRSENYGQALFQPTGMMVGFRVGGGDLGTINVGTDFKADVSRNDGATWNEVTLVRRAVLADGQHWFSSSWMDVTNQSASAQVCWRFRTFNNKHLWLSGSVLKIR